MALLNSLGVVIPNSLGSGDIGEYPEGESLGKTSRIENSPGTGKNTTIEQAHQCNYLYWPHAHQFPLGVRERGLSELAAAVTDAVTRLEQNAMQAVSRQVRLVRMQSKVAMQRDKEMLLPRIS